MRKFRYISKPPYYTNMFMLVDANGSAVVIDPDDSAQNFLDDAKSAGGDIKAIFLTHGHTDHMRAAVELAQKTGAKIYVHKLDAQQYDIKADEYLEHGKKYSFGDELVIEVLHTPGHTVGSCCFICGNDMFCGDTLFAGSIGRTDLAGGSYTAIEASLAQLCMLTENYNVLPGHGEFSTLDEEKRQNPYLADL